MCVRLATLRRANSVTIMNLTGLWAWIRLPAVMLAVALASTATTAQQPPAPQVTVAQPLAQRVTQWDEFSGRFEAVNTVDIRPRVSGVLEQVHFKDGQIVQMGEPLFTIDQRPFRIAQELADADILRTRAQVSLQESEVERAAPLARSGALTGREFETRQANLAIARAQLASAEANAKSAALNLEWTVVKAPIAGRISSRKVDAGNLVSNGQSGQATLLTTIVSQDPVHFVFDISEADFLHYARLYLAGKRQTSRDTANPVRVRLADEKKWSHTGTMDFIDNQLNVRSGTLRGRAIFENKNDLLYPGVFARLQLFGGEFAALLVPDSAVVSDQARKIVFLVGADNMVKPAPVTLGQIVDGLRVVTSGLGKDDRVVIDGLANPAVRPGAKVTPQAGEIKAVASNN